MNLGGIKAMETLNAFETKHGSGVVWEIMLFTSFALMLLLKENFHF